MKRLAVLVILLCVPTLACAQYYDPLQFPPGVTIYKPPPPGGGPGWVYGPNGFTYIRDPGGGGPVIGINIPGRARDYPSYPSPFDPDDD